MNNAHPQRGHHLRLRRRLLQGGIDGFLDYEVVELLLSLVSRKNQKSTARRLLSRFKTISGVLQATPEELQQVDGVGPMNYFGIKLVQEVARRNLQEKIHNAEFAHSAPDVVAYLRHALRDRRREQFLVLYLDNRNRIMALETLFQGSLNCSVVYPREVVRRALEHNAAAVVLVHNHPSGNPNPSADDRNITRKIQHALHTVDIRVHDHLIVAGNDFVSFANTGLM